ncbi:MAG: hypothetical protein J6V53_06665 [Alphaproteobacteria bacterium]|nr:hypothetical protein [Alphaproteobacteria bacterium]
MKKILLAILISVFCLGSFSAHASFWAKLKKQNNWEQKKASRIDDTWKKTP